MTFPVVNILLDKDRFLFGDENVSVHLKLFLSFVFDYLNSLHDLIQSMNLFVEGEICNNK